MIKQNCESCKWGTGNKGLMWCCRHAPIVIPNPKYRESSTIERIADKRITLSVQPETSAESDCGDWEEKE